MGTPPDIETTVGSALSRLDISYEVISIDPEFADTAVFCQQYGFTLESCGNTIMVASRREPKQFCACVVRGSDRLDVNRTVKGLMKVSRLSFASAEDTAEVTGMLIGGVTPFALPGHIPVYADDKLLTLEYVILGSGSRSSKIKLAPDELKKIPGVEFVAGLSINE